MYTSASSSWWMRSHTSPVGASFSSTVRRSQTSGVFHSMDEVEVTNILRHPLVGIASDSGTREVGVGMPHPRGYGTNTRVLGRYVRELRVITLEDAIRKMTSQPATAFRMKGRGLLRPTYLASGPTAAAM